MNREMWLQILDWESDPEVTRVQEWFPTGPQSKPQVFAVRYFKQRGKPPLWYELGYYIPLLQPEGKLQIFKIGGREWSDEALRRVGL